MRRSENNRWNRCRVQGKVIYPRSAAELLFTTQSELEATVAPAPCIHPQAGRAQILVRHSHWLIWRAALLPLPYSYFFPCRSEIETSGCKGTHNVALAQLSPVNRFLRACQPEACLKHTIGFGIRASALPSPLAFHRVRDVSWSFFFTEGPWSFWKVLENFWKLLPFHSYFNKVLHSAVKSWFQMNILIRSCYIKHVNFLVFSTLKAEQLRLLIFLLGLPSKVPCEELNRNLLSNHCGFNKQQGRTSEFSKGQSIRLCPWESSL